MNTEQLARDFHALHVKGSPVILYNIWDAGSAQAIAGLGAKAIASGSHGVANAQGFEDGEQIPLELALDNARRIVGITDLPVTMDIETGYGETPEAVQASVSKILETGIVGVNIEDQLFGTKNLRSLPEQVERLKAVRAAADAADVALFINARTDLFKNADPADHSELIDEAVERAEAYAEAGADGFFAPGLSDITLIKQLCDKVTLPVNIIRLPSVTASNQELAEAGVARISYGPIPYLQMIEWLKEQAGPAYGLSA